jgi:demethylmenaquinone methyltransferase/2-methoxy-6-polyprenyl-1,4-benzoquinol methylase
LAYARASQATTRIVGTDFCRPMLSLAREKSLRSKAAGRITLLEADTLRLPFADDAFQIVSVAFGLRNVSDTDGGLREMTRVCRPGGRVAILEFSTPTHWPLGMLYSWYFRRVLPRIGQTLARNRQAAYNYLPSSVLCFPQAEALAERMRAAGLVSVEYHPFTFGIATLYVGKKPASRQPSPTSVMDIQEGNAALFEPEARACRPPDITLLKPDSGSEKP